MITMGRLDGTYDGIHLKMLFSSDVYISGNYKIKTAARMMKKISSDSNAFSADLRDEYS